MTQFSSSIFSRSLQNEGGATMIEYSLLGALVALVAVAGVVSFSPWIGAYFYCPGAVMNNVSGNPPVSMIICNPLIVVP